MQLIFRLTITTYNFSTSECRYGNKAGPVCKNLAPHMCYTELGDQCCRTCGNMRKNVTGKVSLYHVNQK